MIFIGRIVRLSMSQLGGVAFLLFVGACDLGMGQSETGRLVKIVESPNIQQRLTDWVDEELVQHLETNRYNRADPIVPGDWMITDDNFNWDGLGMNPRERGIRIEVNGIPGDDLSIDQISFVSFADRSRIAIVVTPTSDSSFDVITESNLIYKSDRIGIYCVAHPCSL